MLVSSLFRHSSASILCSLFIWVLLTLILPNLSPYVAAQVYRVPSVTRVEKEVFRLIQTERDELAARMQKDIREKFARSYGQMFEQFLQMPEEGIRSRVAADDAFKQMYESFRNENDEAVEEANRTQKEKADRLEKDLQIRTERQVKAARLIAGISPFAQYLFIATDLTGTGLRSLDHFSSISGEYEGALWGYVDKIAKEARLKDPTYDVNSFLDLHDRPRFNYTEELLRDKLNAVLPWWAALAAFSLFLFAGAFVAFLRYDVR